MKVSHKKFIVLLGILLVFALIYLSGLQNYLNLNTLQGNAILLQNISRNYYFPSIVAFVIIYILVVAFSIPGASLLTLTGGFLYGTLIATLLVNIGATIGATGAFLSSRYLVGDLVQKKYGKRLKKFNEQIEKNGHSYFLTIRFIPAFPFFLVNLLAGLTKVRTRTFIWTTSLGILPGSLIYAFAGKQLSLISSIGDLLSYQMVIAFSLLALLAIFPVIIKKLKKGVKN